jgi:hypothetical protein
MGREVRMVPPGWEHPRYSDGSYIPLFAGPFSLRLAEWERGYRKWQAGKRWCFENKWVPIEDKYKGMAYEEWDGKKPQKEDYMPEWGPGECTCYMMYENVTEGTPISPAFETPEELAHWLADNNASAFADETAPYEAWLHTIIEGNAPSFFFSLRTGKTISGVTAMYDLDQEKK